MAPPRTPALAAGTPAPPYPAALTITGPAWQSALAGQGAVPLVRPEVHLDRLAGNEIVLSDAGASRTHAVIR